MAIYYRIFSRKILALDIAHNISETLLTTLNTNPTQFQNKASELVFQNPLLTNSILATLFKVSLHDRSIKNLFRLTALTGGSVILNHAQKREDLENVIFGSNESDYGIFSYLVHITRFCSDSQIISNNFLCTLTPLLKTLSAEYHSDKPFQMAPKILKRYKNDLHDSIKDFLKWYSQGYNDQQFLKALGVPGMIHHIILIIVINY